MKSKTLKKCHLLKYASVLLLWLTVTHVFAQITISAQDKTLREALREVERTSDYRFFFNETLPGLDETVSIQLTDANIETAMQQLLAGTGIEYQKSDDNVIALVARATTVAQAQPAPVAATAQQATTRNITGTVTDSAGEPIIGATIVVQGVPALGAITNVGGQFTLNNAPADGNLVITFIGMVTQTIPINNRTTINIVLQDDTELLGELVVVGYTIRRRESVVGAISTVSGEQLRVPTSSSVANMLVSQVAGVHVAPGSTPGQVGAVVIRGQSSFTDGGASPPLWVIDGVIVGRSQPAWLNSANIESINILKDAASTAIFGSEGANGVIVITTHTPRPGQLNINFQTRMGASTRDSGRFRPMNGAELFDLWNSFTNRDAITAPLWGPELRNRDFSWWDYVVRTGFVQEHNLTVSGGTEQIRSSFSIGIHDDTGIIRGRDWRRYNFQHRSVYRPTNWLTITPTISGARTEVNSTYMHSLGAAFYNLPWDSPYDAQGNLVPDRPGSDVWVLGNNDNYLNNLGKNISYSNNHSFSGSLVVDVRLTNWLSFSSTNNFTWAGHEFHSVTDPRTRVGQGVGGRIEEWRSSRADRATTQMLRVGHIFNDVHEIQGLVAYEYRDFRSRHLDITGTGFLPGFRILDVVTTPERTRGGMTTWAMQSVFTNLHYTFDHRYFVEFSARRDGASNFGRGNQWGNFASIGGGWNIHREHFFDVEAIDILRPRISYGVSGTTPHLWHPSFDLYTAAAGAAYGGESGLLISQIGNRYLTWESNYNFNVGFDLAMFQNRVRLTANYYIRNNDNLLFQTPLPGVVGVTSIWQNVGLMRNQGFDVTVGADIIRNQDLHWTFDFNIGVNRNRIIRLPGERDASGNVPDIVIGSGVNIAGSGNRILREGIDANTWFIPLWAGVNPETGAPQWYRVDERGYSTGEIVNTIGQAGRGMAGTKTPDFFGGFSTHLAWRQFDMGMVFGYSVGAEIVNYARLEFDSDGAYTDRNQMRMLPGWNRWQQPGDIATHPAPAMGGNNSAHHMSSRWLEDGSFLKLRSLSIGYNLALPQHNITNIRLSLTGENLFTLTRYSGIDPELPPVDGRITGTAGPTITPNSRKFMFGANITF